MIYMNSRQDITRSFSLLPDSAARFLLDFFNQLHKLLGQDRIDKPFRLSEHGYTLILFEPMELLPDIQFTGILKPDSHVEYAERIILDDVQLFKVCLMDDNEHIIFIFSVVGTQTEEIERWFASQEQGGWSA